MTGNEIGDEGAKTMSEVLELNKSLKSLDLSSEEDTKRKEKRKTI